MKLSVIIPVYNVEKYLSECLDSIISQDFDDYEVLCIDDGSTDLSLEILKDYERRYHQIKVICHEYNQGQSAARNTGIKQASGKYIQFIDSDDLVKPDTFKTLYSIAEENSTDVLFFNMEIWNDVDNNLIRDDVRNRYIGGIHTGLDMFCQLSKANVSKPEVCRQFMLRDFLLKKQLFFKEGILHEDVLFSFMVVMEAQRVMDSNLYLYIYRQRLGSTMWSIKSERAASMYVCVITMCNYWLSHNFTEEQDAIIADYIEKMYSNYEKYRNCHEYIKPLGDFKEKAIYDIMHRQYSSAVSMKDDDIERLKKSKMNILYGAGYIATEVLKLMKKYHISINYIAVSDVNNNPNVIGGIVVKSIEELSEYREGIVIIGTTPKWHKGILSALEECGFNNLIIPDCKFSE